MGKYRVTTAAFVKLRCVAKALIWSFGVAVKLRATRNTSHSLLKNQNVALGHVMRGGLTLLLSRRLRMTRCIVIFYPLLLSWLDENGFENFYQALSPRFGLARTCGVPRGRDAARRGRHEFAPDGSGRDCVPSTPVGTSGREMTKGGPERH